MKSSSTYIAMAILCSFLLISETLGNFGHGHGSGEVENFNLGRRPCRVPGESFKYTRPDGYSMSCTCQAPTQATTTTAATTTTTVRPTRRPRPTPRPHNSWACTTTAATTTTAAPPTTTTAQSG